MTDKPNILNLGPLAPGLERLLQSIVDAKKMRTAVRTDPPLPLRKGDKALAKQHLSLAAALRERRKIV